VAVLAAALDARCQDHEIAAQQLAWQALENLRRQPAKMISTALDVPNRAIVY
jgi:hypothetical protein